MHEENRRRLAELIQEKVALIEKPVLPDSVVDVLATVGAGHLADDTSPLTMLDEAESPSDPHDELSGALVRRFHDGLHPMPPPPDGVEKPFRNGVDAVLDQHQEVAQDTVLRETLATLALGFADESQDDAERRAIGSHVARYYLGGLG